MHLHDTLASASPNIRVRGVGHCPLQYPNSGVARVPLANGKAHRGPDIQEKKKLDQYRLSILRFARNWDVVERRE